jgi:hypothetical protein
MNLKCLLYGHDYIPARVPDSPFFHVPYYVVKDTISYAEWKAWQTGKTGENPIVVGYDVLICKRCRRVK